MKTNEPISSPEQTNTSSSSEIQASQEPVVNKKITISLLVILVVLLLGTTGVFAYKYFELKQQVDNQQFSSPTLPDKDLITSPSSIPSPLPTTNPTANWKSYANEKYDFIIKHPVDFDLSESTLMEDFIVDFFWVKEEVGHKPGISIRIINAVGPAWLDVKDYFEKQFFNKTEGSETSGDKGKTTITEKTKIEGFDTVKTIEETVPGAPTEAYYSVNTYIYRGGRVYRLTLYATSKSVALGKEATYNLMLSTFKFIK